MFGKMTSGIFYASISLIKPNPVREYDPCELSKNKITPDFDNRRGPKPDGAALVDVHV